MGLPIGHKIDHPLVYIDSEDSAWDHDRIKYERAVLDGKLAEEPGRPVPQGCANGDEHPWWQYVMGRTRCNLAGVEEYLTHKDGPEGPIRFHFERLPINKWNTARTVGESTHQGQVYVLRNSLVRISGYEFKLRDGEPLNDSEHQALRETFGDRVVNDLAFVAVRANLEITSAEKKS